MSSERAPREAPPAVILVGGEGPRRRPLTDTLPKEPLDLLKRDGRVHASADIGADAILLPPVIVGPHACIEARSRIGPFVHLGRGARVGRRRAPLVDRPAGSRLPPQSPIARAIVHPELGAPTP
jgi:NDP-sugar pyrophosphorylase family protein